ncbi:unnamed protein product [Toxocara canis]|uniref:GLOBIN domain-containing protein n=1 Tax=Toxocara canis TaxID=6265 RepID=A0A183UUV2_TOXCA|nr:unnamed protein product [Toxocara canis]
MGNKASTAPSTSPVQALQKSTVRRNSEYRSRTVETPNPEEHGYGDAKRFYIFRTAIVLHVRDSNYRAKLSRHGISVVQIGFRRVAQVEHRVNFSEKSTRRRWSAVVATQRCMSIKPKRLSPRHRNLIIKSWSKTNKSKIARDTFVELFKTSADIRSKFVFGDVPIKRLKQEDRFLAHCERFVAALDSVIAHLDEIGAVIENAEALGKYDISAEPIHAAMAKDLRNEHWRLFGDILVERIIENDTKQPSGGSEVHAAWKMLGQLLVFHMRLGYDRETLRTVRDNRLLAVTDPRTDNNHLCIPDHGVR